MCSKPLIRAISVAILSCASLFGLYKEDTARIWVLREGEIAECDASSWAVAKIIKVPEEFSKYPDELQITRTGQMLFCIDPDIQLVVPGKHFDFNNIWIWDGRIATALDRRVERETPPQGSDRGRKPLEPPAQGCAAELLCTNQAIPRKIYAKRQYFNYTELA